MQRKQKRQSIRERGKAWRSIKFNIRRKEGYALHLNYRLAKGIERQGKQVGSWRYKYVCII